MKKLFISILFTAVLAAALLLCAHAAEPTVSFTRGTATITINGTEYALTEVFADANGDGSFNAADARYILRLSAKLEDYAAPEYFDVSGDGKLDAGDARIALRYTAKLDRIYTAADNKRPSGICTGDDGRIYAFTNYGAIASGFYETDGRRYYFGQNGKAATGLTTIDGNLYFFTDSGVMFDDGWIDLRGKTYYFNPDGKAAAGLTMIDEDLYFFDENGVAARDTFKTIDGNTYYFDSDNTAASYFFMVGTDLYYFYPETFIMAKNKVIDDYFFGPDGKAVIEDIPGPGPEDPDIDDPEPEKYTPAAETLRSDVYKQAKQVVKNNNLKTPEDVYNYVKRSHYFTYNVENGKTYSPLSQVEKKGWTHFAEYAFDNTPAICYYYAAECAILFDAMGIENRIVYGTGHYESEHYWNQAKVNGKWINYDACNGYCAVTDDYLKQACIINDRYEGKDGYTFGEYVYPVFR